MHCVQCRSCLSKATFDPRKTGYLRPLTHRNVDNSIDLEHTAQSATTFDPRKERLLTRAIAIFDPRYLKRKLLILFAFFKLPTIFDPRAKPSKSLFLIRFLGLYT